MGNLLFHFPRILKIYFRNMKRRNRNFDVVLTVIKSTKMCQITAVPRVLVGFFIFYQSLALVGLQLIAEDHQRKLFWRNNTCNTTVISRTGNKVNSMYKPLTVLNVSKKIVLYIRQDYSIFESYEQPEKKKNPYFLHPSNKRCQSRLIQSIQMTTSTYFA